MENKENKENLGASRPQRPHNAHGDIIEDKTRLYFLGKNSKTASLNFNNLLKYVMESLLYDLMN